MSQEFWEEHLDRQERGCHASKKSNCKGRWRGEEFSEETRAPENDAIVVKKDRSRLMKEKGADRCFDWRKHGDAMMLRLRPAKKWLKEKE